jgi:hypothetical protein
VKLKELKTNFPEILSVATLEPGLSDDAEVELVQEPAIVALAEETEQDKDRRIAELEATLNDTNKKLAELVNKDSQKTDIVINIDKANVRKANNPLILAFRKLKR